MRRGPSRLEERCALLLLHLERRMVRLVKRLLYRKFRAGQRLSTVLVFRTGRLGDFLNAVPALNLLRSRLPEARVILATTASSLPEMQSITGAYADLNALPWLEFVTPAVVNRALSFAMTGRGRGLGAMGSIIREEQPDVIFVLSNLGDSLAGKLRKLVYFRLAGFKGPIFGFDSLASGYTFARSQYQLGLYEHEVLGPARAVSECAAIGAFRESELVQEVSIPAPAMSWARSLVRGLGWLDNNLIAVSPGATFSHKVWPTDGYVRVCRELWRRYDGRFVLVGIAADRHWAEVLQAELGTRCVDMTGRTSVTQLAALLSLCRLCVGNDGGPAHLASAAGCPCVTVTSALDFPGRWEPWNSRLRVARVRIECEFCLSLTCCPLKTNACSTSIDPQQVLRMCSEVLEVSLEHRPHRQAALCPDRHSC